ncbi:MAG: riboflavin kinase, partial [Christensenellaceae bacterium]
MLTIRYRQDRYESPCALVLGCFDGIHKGHALLIDEAKRTGLPVGLMLLDGKGEDELFTREERLWIAERAGVDFCLLVTLDHETMTTPPEAFLYEITSRIAVHTFVCGEDFRFGDGARGTPALLAKAHRTIVVPLLSDGEGKIASSRIKQYVRLGEMERANALLSVPYFVRGEVRHGRGVGRTYGFPTANIAWDRAKCPPGLGVYAVSVGEYRGIANYGGRPTFG